MKLKFPAVILAAMMPALSATASDTITQFGARIIDGKCVQNGVVLREDSCLSAKMKGLSNQPAITQQVSITHGAHVGGDGTRYSRICPTEGKGSCTLAQESSAKKLEIVQQLPSRVSTAEKTYEQYQKDYDNWHASLSSSQKALAQNGGAGVAAPLDRSAFLNQSHMESYLNPNVTQGTAMNPVQPNAHQPMKQQAISAEVASNSVVTHGAHVGGDGTRYSRICPASGKGSCTLAQESTARKMEIANQLPARTSTAGKTYSQYVSEHNTWQSGMTSDQKVIAQSGGAGIAAPLDRSAFLRQSHLDSVLQGM